jgi:hypothetical protein
MKPTCSCSRPITDSAYLCRSCTDTLEQHLAELPALAAEIETTRVRQSRMGGQAIGIVVRSANRPVPWNDKAATLANALKVKLVGWVRLCQSWQVRPEGPACRICPHRTCILLRSDPAETVEGLSGYLLAALPALRHRPEVVECVDSLTAIAKAAEGVIDRRAEQTFYGPCGSVDYIGENPDPQCVPCPTDLYGPADAQRLVCDRCAAEHDVADVRAYLIRAAQDQLVTAADLSKFLTAYGEPITFDRIRKWVEREQLVPHGRDAAGRPTYRVSEAADLLASMNQRRKAS